MAKTKNQVLSRSKPAKKRLNPFCRHLHEANGRVVSLVVDIEPSDAINNCKPVQRIKYGATIFRPNNLTPNWTRKAHFQTALNRFQHKPVELVVQDKWIPQTVDSVVQVARIAMFEHGVAEKDKTE